jgi:hypothetical protein
MRSAYFSQSALKALNRLGDILLPANDGFPSFSKYGGLEHIDKMVCYAPIEDISDLNAALGIFNLLPTFLLRFLVRFMARAQNRKGPLATIFRQLNLAIRGLLFACYYAERPGSGFEGKDPAEVINFHINRVGD